VGRAKDFLRQIGRINALNWEDFNPDAELDLADLDPWIQFLSRNAWNVTASLWFPGEAGAENAARLMYRYLLHKRQAMALRRVGNIQSAEVSEKMCDRIYALLPGYARW
jgi:hypothetical protein